VITRLVCLIFALCITAVGLNEKSLLLMILGAAIVALALSGLKDAEEPRRPPPSVAPTWHPRRLSRRGRMIAGYTVALAVLTVALSSEISLIWVSVATWLLAIGGLVALGLHLDSIHPRELVARARLLFAKEHRPELASVLAITAVGFAMRYYDVEMIPPAFHGDEGFMGLLALDIMDGKRYPFFATSPLWGLPYLFNYLQALTMAIFGDNVYGLRMLSVICGTLCVPVTYAIGRAGWGPAAGAVAAWLIAVSHLHVHHSRMGVIFIESALLMALMLLLLALAWNHAQREGPVQGPGVGSVSEAGPPPMRRGMWTLLILAGAICALSQYFYFASRVVPIVAAPLLLIMWRSRRINFWQGVAFAVAFLVIYAPLAAHYIEIPDQFYGRLRDVSIFQPQYVKDVVGPNATLPSALPALFAEQTRRSLNLFMQSGDQSGFYSGNTPTFDVVMAAMIWLGLGAALARPFRYHEAAVLLWFGLGLFFGSVLTLGAISGQRILIMTTSAYLFGGLFVARLMDLIRQTELRKADWLLAPAGTTLALWLLSANVVIYFYEFAPRMEDAEATVVGRELRDAGPTYHVYFLTSPRFDPNHGAVQFISHRAAATNILPNAPVQPPDDGLGLLFLALEPRLPELKAIEGRFPGGQERPFRAPTGRLLYVAYQVPPAR
jgi:4-amino-4-deoxy-L-arabinose transferase-like glycosyltransferase